MIPVTWVWWRSDVTRMGAVGAEGKLRLCAEAAGQQVGGGLGRFGCGWWPGEGKCTATCQPSSFPFAFGLFESFKRGNEPSWKKIDGWALQGDGARRAASTPRTSRAGLNAALNLLQLCASQPRVFSPQGCTVQRGCWPSSSDLRFALSPSRAAHRRLQPVQPDPPGGTVGLHAAGLRARR